MKPRKDKEIGPFLAEPAAGARMRYSIQCGECGANEALGLQNFSYAVARGVLPKKFAALGWRVGSRAAKHVCPACQEKATNNMQSTTDKGVVAMTPAAKAEEPRSASIDERRIINEKLADVYGNKGYTGDWTDEKLARDLGVPRAWVAQVREFSYGPNLNENDVKALAVAQEALNSAGRARAELVAIRVKVIEEINAIIAKVDAKISDVRRLVEGR